MRLHRHSLCALAALLVVLTASCDWPMFQYGPAHTGFNPYEQKIGVGNVGSLTTDWTGPTKSAPPASPAVSKGVAYVASDDTLFAFSASGTNGCSGAPTVCDPLWSATPGGAAMSSPAVANNTVFVASDAGKLYAFDAAGSTGCSGTPKTCSPLWTATLNVNSEFVTDPSVAEGMVFAGTSSGTLAAFDVTGTTNCSGSPKTCDPLWTATTQSAMGTSPTVADGVVYVGTGARGGGTFYAFDAETGALLWTFTNGQEIWSSAAVANGIVYVPLSAGFSGTVAALAAFDASATTSCSGTPKTCNPLWIAPTASSAFLSSPAVANGVVYVGSGFGILYAFDAGGSTGCSGAPKTCAPLWTVVTTNPARAISTPTVANGVVYVGAGGGYAYAFDAAGSTGCSGTPKTCTPLWTFTNDANVSPVVANGVVYVAAGNQLDALTVPSSGR
jgi:outer membrane protein assembly factor BamB